LGQLGILHPLQQSGGQGVGVGLDQADESVCHHHDRTSQFSSMVSFSLGGVSSRDQWHVQV
jgi:hypothetical protein